MLLVINFDTKQVLEMSKGHVVLDLKHYGEFAIGCSLVTTHGNSLEEKERKNLKVKHVVVGQRGGITFG